MSDQQLDPPDPFPTFEEDPSSQGGVPVVGEDDNAGARTALPFPVAGIGASAGGLKAFTELLGAVPADTGISFVIISHLSPQHKSMLAEILARTTAMPVSEAEDGAALEPNHVYVIPPGQHLTLAEGRLRLDPRLPGDRIHRSVDEFFCSLAREQRHCAIGIVLSGTDSDGSVGLQAIKSEGGISIVQEEATAQFDEMPRNAINHDHVDLVLSPADIGRELARIAQEMRNGVYRRPEELPGSDNPHQIVRRIYRHLRLATGVDFSQYKQTTVRRRITRRMVVRRTDTLSDYLELLADQPAEVLALYEDLLIGVTRFFRDASVFVALRDVIFPELWKDRVPDGPIRVWVPGCASGEEVYSIAICLLEHLGSLPFQSSIQIFGTDLSDRAIDRARAAFYPESISADVSPERLARFFIKVDQGYQLSKRVRELCIFAKHNVGQDPPFSQLDLISCRNVLIYLGPELQRRIVPTFHYALKPHGILLLGNSETIRQFYDLFTLVDKRQKFYAKVDATVPVRHEIITQIGKFQDLAEPSRLARNSARDVVAVQDLQRLADRTVLARYGPPGVVINDKRDVVQVRGDISPYLTPPPGNITLNIVRMAKEGLGPGLVEILDLAQAHDIAATSPPLFIVHDNQSIEFTVEVLPLQRLANSPVFYLVLFKRTERPAKNSGTAPVLDSESQNLVEEGQREVALLRQHLGTTKLYLQSLVEEREAKNQELLSANEEIQSANEELQSINEELETAKEELQSSNEELQTVNEELRTRNSELSQTTNDLANLLNNITFPVLMLSSDLRIRQFTPMGERVLNLRGADVGRSVSEIRLNLRIDDLEPLLREVMDSLATREMEVQDRQGNWHLLRARPYRTRDNRIDGVVVVLVDIDQIRRAQQELSAAHALVTTVLESVQVPIVVLNENLTVRLANRAFLGLIDMSAERVQSQAFPHLVEQAWKMDSLLPSLQKLMDSPSSDAAVTFEHEYPATGQVLSVVAQSLPGQPARAVMISIEDVTMRRRVQQHLEEDKERLQGRVQVTERELDRHREELQRLAASLMTAQEDERRRVARDLHDDLGQKLALLEMSVERLDRDLPEDPGVIHSQLQQIRSQFEKLSNDLRQLAYQIHPQVLDDLGLPFALQRLGDDFENRESMPVRFVARNLPPAIPRAVSTVFYRVAQEALRNIAKHAGNTPVEIRLECEADILVMTVRDQGKGFDQVLTRGSNGGLGMVSMQERVRLVQGTITIDTMPGDGTTIVVRVPLDSESTC